jgi:hypothetical protein
VLVVVVVIMMIVSVEQRPGCGRTCLTGLTLFFVKVPLIFWI